MPRAHAKLVHKNPRLNDPNMWYRRVDQMMESDWYFATIWGPKGMISSVIYAVLRSDYEIVSFFDKEEPKQESVDEFF